MSDYGGGDDDGDVGNYEYVEDISIALSIQEELSQVTLVLSKILTYVVLA